MDISALLFDMDDVLYDATVWRRWLLRLLGHLGLHTHYDAFFHVWERCYLCDVYSGNRDYWDAFRSFLDAAGLSSGQVDEVTAASQTRKREFDLGIRAFPGVNSTLTRLSMAGVPLGVLCNSSRTSVELQHRLAQIGLGRHFQFVVSSRDLQRAMPVLETYQAALSQFGRNNEVAYVGHDAVELDGAAKLGITAIGFNHSPSTEPEIAVDRFADLLNVVKLPSMSRLAAG